MESSPDLEFDHFLTERLGFRTVADMRALMPMAEYQAWWIYYARKAQRRELAIEQARG